MLLHIDAARPTKSGKSLGIKAGGKDYLAKVDSGLSAGMQIEAEVEVSEYDGKSFTWIRKWKALAAPAGAAPANPGRLLQQPVNAPWWMPFVSNTVAHAIQAGKIEDFNQIAGWAQAAKAAAEALLTAKPTGNFADMEDDLPWKD